jgi:hypothetical protein
LSLSLGIALAAAACAPRTASPQDELPESVLSARCDGYLYEYHVPTGHESLFDLRREDRALSNVLRQHRDVAERCREQVLQEQKVAEFDELRVRYAAQIRRLRALGYL